MENPLWRPLMGKAERRIKCPSIRLSIYLCHSLPLSAQITVDLSITEAVTAIIIIVLEQLCSQTDLGAATDTTIACALYRGYTQCDDYNQATSRDEFEPKQKHRSQLFDSCSMSPSNTIKRCYMTTSTLPTNQQWMFRLPPSMLATCMK